MNVLQYSKYASEILTSFCDFWQDAVNPLMTRSYVESFVLAGGLSVCKIQRLLFMLFKNGVIHLVGYS